MSVTAPSIFLIGKLASTYNQIQEELEAAYIYIAQSGDQMKLSLSFNDLTCELSSISKYVEKLSTYFGLDKSEIKTTIDYCASNRITVLIEIDSQNLVIQFDNK